jgi:hypothetical protein
MTPHTESQVIPVPRGEWIGQAKDDSALFGLSIGHIHELVELGYLRVPQFKPASNQPQDHPEPAPTSEGQPAVMPLPPPAPPPLVPRSLIYQQHQEALDRAAAAGRTGRRRPRLTGI